MATGLKHADQAIKPVNATIQGKVLYNQKYQKELQFIVEGVKEIGSLMFPYNLSHDPNDSTLYAFPGFVWAILMKR